MDSRFEPFDEKMRAAKLPDAAIETFRRHYEQLARGAQAMIPETEIDPVDDLPDAEALSDQRAAGLDALDRCVVVKLNGGLGTSMGMTQAKSLLPAKDGHRFIDVIVRQVLALRAESDARLPLVLMDSFRTRADSLAALAEHPDIASDLPSDFLQHKIPKVLADDLRPVTWPADPEAEWCPPGHGDLYTALVTSGMLERMRGAGYRWAFVSNSDNLGATLDPAILGFVVSGDLPFLMEVADRTEADRKGGHLARDRDGRLLLRESAQCPEADAAAFTDVSRHRYFNTNNLWLDLDALASALEAGEGVIDLPSIHNEKTVDPRDPSSPRVIQLETAMGAAIAVFEGARALRVPRERFAPVKTTNDLLVLWSDVYRIDERFRVVRSPAVPEIPVVDLDPAYYKKIDDLRARFPAGAPSLAACRRLSVRGNFRFGADVTVEGEVVLENPSEAVREIRAGASLAG